MNSLTLIYTQKGLKKVPHVFYEYSFTTTDLSLHFAVESESIFADPDFPKHKSCWGLWNMDVVEFYGSLEGNPHYYEFQVSPYNQYCELEIIRHHKELNLSYKSNFIHVTKLNSDHTSWEATLNIPIKSLAGNNNELRDAHMCGNFFAILGYPGKRCYFSAFLPKTKKSPDFHQAEYFRLL
jgi:hypothetical protein